MAPKYLILFDINADTSKDNNAENKRIADGERKH